MKCVDQDVLVEQHGFGNCLQAAVASIIEFPLNTVPNFILFEKWYDRMVEFLNEKGFDVSGEPTNNEYALAFGDSPRGTKHAVVMMGDDIVHDPHPSKGGVTGVYWKASIRKQKEAFDGIIENLPTLVGLFDKLKQ